MKHSLVLRTALCALTASAAALLAGQYRSLEELTRDSALVVLGRVDSASSYEGGDGEVYTDVTLAADAVVKDEAGQVGEGPLRFTVKGGTVGDRVVAFSDAPRFVAGEEVALFAGGAQYEKRIVDPVNGPALVARILAFRADSGQPLSPDTLDRTGQFLRRVDRGGAGRGGEAGLGEVELNAAADCAAYMGPKWGAPGTTFALATTLPAMWSTPLQAAAAAWNSAGSRFAFTQSSGSPHVLAAGDLGNTGTLASTRVEYSLATKLIARFSMTFNSRYSWSTTGEAGKIDVQAIATHELGHALGLTHPGLAACAEETMWASAGAGELKKRSLEAGDKAGVATLYGSSTGSTTVPPPATPAPVPAAPRVTNFALVTLRAVAAKPLTILVQGTGIDPAAVQGYFTGGACGTAGCVAAPFAASAANAVFIQQLPAGTYTLAVRNTAGGVKSAANTFTVHAN